MNQKYQLSDEMLQRLLLVKEVKVNVRVKESPHIDRWLLEEGLGSEAAEVPCRVRTARCASGEA